MVFKVTRDKNSKWEGTRLRFNSLVKAGTPTVLMTHMLHTVTRVPVCNINRLLSLSMVETAGALQCTCVLLYISQPPLGLAQPCDQLWPMGGEHSDLCYLRLRQISIWCVFRILFPPSTCPYGDDTKVTLKLQDYGAVRWSQPKFLSCHLEENLPTIVDCQVTEK